MYKLKTILAIFGLIVFCFSSAYSISSEAGTDAGAFMKIGLGSPRAQALGRSYSALASGADSLYWNPAGIATSQQKEFFASHLQWVQDYTGNTIAYIQPMGQAVLGVHLAYMTIELERIDTSGIPIGDPIRVQHSFGGITLATGLFNKNINIGGTVKRVSENNDGTEYASVVFDVGAQIKLGRLASVGGAYQNIGGGDDVVQIIRYGAAVNFSQYVTVTAELEDPSDNRSRIGGGIEFSLPESLLQLGKFSLRLGYHDYDDMGTNREDAILKDLRLDKTSKLSFGFGLESRELFGYGFGLDFAFMPSGALGKIMQIAVKFIF